MKRIRIVAIAVTAVFSIALFSWGAIAGAGEVMGIVTRQGAAQIIVSDQPDADRTVRIDKVVAPSSAFVVIHQNVGGMPGERLGYARVAKGTSRGVRVTLDPKVAMTPQLLAAVHVDRGKKGSLEFDMKNAARSPDRPFFVGGKEVAAAFKAAEFGVPASMSEVSIEAADQPLTDGVTIAKVVAPANAFVVVHKAKADGMPGERVGYASIGAGENTGVKVTLSKKLAGRVRLIAAVHADRGRPGRLEFDMDRPVDSPDQPFFVDGMEAAVVFDAGPFGVNVAAASVTAADQIGASSSIRIDEVDAPRDAWIVVHKDAGGAPGERVGLIRVKAGTTRNVRVPLSTNMLPENLIVAVHADRGTTERFDFDMDDKLGSADQPFFVNGEEVATVIQVRSFGYPVSEGSAAIAVPEQTVSDAKLLVTRAVAPEPAWVVVHLDAGGMPGARIGLLAIPAGQTLNALVQLDASKPLTDTLFVAVHADRGEARLFEFNMMDRVNSPDQPYFVDDTEVATAVPVF